MHRTINLRDEHALVHPPAYLYHFLTGRGTASLVDEHAAGYEIPAADAYARRMAEAAEAWLVFARERSRMKDQTLVSKALHALAFSLRHRLHEFAVVSKLVGTAAPHSQKALWRLTRERVGFGTPLDVVEEKDGKRVRLVVSFEGDVLGEVQGKHVPWLRPLLSWSTKARLVRITGHEHDGYRLGLNCCFTHLESSISALRRALGTDLNPAIGGDGYGDGEAAQALVKGASVVVHSLPSSGGDGLAGDPDDVHLWRTPDGTACASVPHLVRHSPTGIEFGGLGAGCSDLAYSVLAALFDEEVAGRHCVAFKEDVIACVPREGGTLRARDVRAWLARQEDRR